MARMRLRQTSQTRPMVVGLSCVIVVLASLGEGCRGERTAKRPRQILPDLDHQPKYQAQQRSTFFKDYRDPETGKSYGRTQRMPIVGTVAFGKKPWDTTFDGVDFSQRNSMLQDDPELYEGTMLLRNAAGQIQYDENGAAQTTYVERMPIEKLLGMPRSDPAFDGAMKRFIALGRENFNIYCIVCHGGTGMGDGMVGQRWSYPLPNWHDPQYQWGGEKGADGYLFHTALYGVPNVGANMPYPNKMRGYLGKVSRREAWAIIAYVRVLQETHKGTSESVPPSRRQELGAPGGQASSVLSRKEQSS